MCQALVKVELLSSLYAKNMSALQSQLQGKLHQRDTTIDALRQQLKTQQDKVRRIMTRGGRASGVRQDVEDTSRHTKSVLGG